MINYKKIMFSLILVCLFSLFQNSYSDILLTDWRVETAYNEPRDASISPSGLLWVATTGGVFSYNPTDSSYQKFNNLSGLSSINISTIITDKNSEMVICGSESGYISIYSDGVWTNIGDIAGSDEIVNKKINSLFIDGDRLLVAGDFGLSELFINPDGAFIDQVFGDSYRNLKVNSVKKIDGKIWICTESGLAYHTGEKTIADKKNWTFVEGLDGENVRDIDIWQNELYVLTDYEAYKGSNEDFDGNFEKVNSNDSDGSNFRYNNFFRMNDSLYASFVFGYQLVERDGDWEKIIDWSDPSRTLISHDGKLLRLTNVNGINEHDDEIPTNIVPNGIISNKIFDMDISSEGILWTSSGISGFSRFDGVSWINFNEIEVGEYSAEKSYRAVDAIGNKAYIAHKGSGQIIVTDKGNDEFEFEIINQFNSSLVAAVGKVVVAGGSAKSSDGIIWTVNWGDRYDGGPVLMSSEDKQYNSFFICDSSEERFYYNIAIDNYDTKWLGSIADIGSQGLMLFNEMGTIDDRSDDLCQVFNLSDVKELPSRVIRSIEVDKNGWVWVGTSKGIVYFINPEAFIYDNIDPANSMIPVKMRGTDGVIDGSGIDVTDIMIDPENRKWIASKNGVWVYDGDGAELLAHFTKENSPLPLDVVTAIKIDEKTGWVYFATDAGLFMARSLSVEPLEQYNISSYPQPFNPQNHGQIIFDGLSYESDIKITTPDGRLVRSLSSKSRKISWNGRDENGVKVESGIYLIIGTSAEGEEKAVGKFAVIYDD
jgi:TSS9, PorZ, N-terminal beta-propeller domain/Two component regulator propeller